MEYIKQSTAITLKIGPFLDDTDGKTPEIGLTIAQADVRVSKNGGDIAQKTEVTSCTHDELGVYGCPIDVTDTDTLGRLQLFVMEAGALPVWHEYSVIPANVYDSMFSTDKLEVELISASRAAIADDVWDELITGAAHNLATSAGRRLRQSADITILRENTCQAGGGNAEIILDVGASAVNDFYLNDLILLTSGTGIGQQRHIVGYVGATRTATVNRDWTTNPDATTDFILTLDSSKEVHCFGTCAKAEINTEVDTALTDYNAALATVCTEARLSELDAAKMPADVDKILADTGTDGVKVAAGSKTGYALSSVGIDDILDEVVESTTTLRQMLRILTAALAGKSTGGGTATVAFRDILDLKDRISATVDENGNRTAISVDGT